MTRLEDEIERLREEIDALTIYAPPVQEAPEDPEETERRRKILECMLEGKEVPDELIREPEEGAIISERDYLPVLKQMIEDGVFGPYPEDEE
jgi:hypothetical protein